MAAVADGSVPMVPVLKPKFSPAVRQITAEAAGTRRVQPRPRGRSAVVLVKMDVSMRLSRHARNEMRLYGIASEDVESTITDPAARDSDDRGNARLAGETADGSAYPCCRSRG